MKSKFNAFRNHMVYVNCKNSNLKKMSYSIQNGFQCIWAPKTDQEEEKIALVILKNNHAVLLCTQTRRKQKSCVLSVLPWQWLHLFLRSQLIVYAVFIQLIFIVLKGMVAPSFNIKTPVLSLLTLIECTSKHESPF